MILWQAASFGRIRWPPARTSLDAQNCLHPEIHNGRHRPRRLLHVHLRFARPAVLEDDWRLAQLAPSELAPEEYFLLERVAARDHPIEPNLSQLRNAVAPEGPARVADAHAKEEPNQPVYPATDRLADDRPVLGSAAGHVARADHHVVPLHSREQVGDVAWRVAEVRVHVEQEVVFIR